MDLNQLCRTLVDGRMIVVRDSAWDRPDEPSPVFAFDLRTGALQREVDIEHETFVAASSDEPTGILGLLPVVFPGHRPSDNPEPGWAVTADAAHRAGVATEAWQEYERLLECLPGALKDWAAKKAVRTRHAQSLTGAVLALIGFGKDLNKQGGMDFPEAAELVYSCSFPREPYPNLVPPCAPDGDPWPDFVANAGHAYAKLVNDRATAALRLKELLDARLREAEAAITPKRGPAIR